MQINKTIERIQLPSLPQHRQTSPGASPLQPSHRAIAESLLGNINWSDLDRGYCGCPGLEFHTTSNGRRDCRVMLNRVPTVHCVHASCRPRIDQLNHELRSAIGKAEAPLKPRRPSPEDLRREAERQKQQRVQQRAEQSLPLILKQFPTMPAKWREWVGSTDDWFAHLDLLFAPNDFVWIGDDVKQSGPGHEDCFRSVAEWRKFRTAPGRHICPSTFKPGTCSRAIENVLVHRFLVVESDTLTKPETFAVFQWLEHFMKLRLIMESGNKSIHAWYEMPPASFLPEVRAILPKLQIDPSAFRPSQPFRLAGAMRDNGQMQRLLFVKGEERP